MNITIKSLSQLQSAAQQFIQNISSRKVFAFYGKMGAGKTTFIKALCEEMGVEDVITSPTFAIVNEYTAKNPPAGSNNTIFHFDFYRIKKLEEAYDMGFEDYINGRSLCFIEWPELIEELLTDDVCKVTIEELPDGTRAINC